MPRLQWFLVLLFAVTVLAGKTHAADEAAKPAEGRAAVFVDARRVLADNDPFWGNLVFHPTEFLSTEWGEQHIALLREAGAARKYVRIYNQPEDAAYLRDDGTVGYRWDHFDRRADLILAQGVKPSIAFFSMPAAIAADPELLRKRPFLDGKPVYLGIPKDFRLWQEMVADFTRHVIRKYGEDEVAKWRFSCWNEPDLSSFSRFKLSEYNALYDHFAAGVRSVSTRIPIGGPSMSSNNIYRNPQLFRGFVEHVARGTNHATGERGSPIDFLTIHTYGGHGAAGSSQSPTPSVEYMLEQQLRLVGVRDEFPELRQVPIVVAEWGVTSGGGTSMDRQPLAEVRNTQFAPAFLATAVARLIDLKLNHDVRIGDMYLCLSGYEVERKRDFEGKRTASTLNGFDKPLLNGYRLLAKLGGQLVASRIEPSDVPVTAIAARDGDRQAAVLVTHFRHDLPKSDGPDTTVELTIDTAWPAGTQVTLHHWRIDQTHSNAYTVFRELGSPRPPTAEETAKIKQRMNVEPLEAPRRLRLDGPVQLTFALPSNALSLIELVAE
jgi:xylan 1,4-beta-xylosidase